MQWGFLGATKIAKYVDAETSNDFGRFGISPKDTWFRANKNQTKVVLERPK